LAAGPTARTLQSLSNIELSGLATVHGLSVNSPDRRELLDRLTDCAGAMAARRRLRIARYGKEHGMSDDLSKRGRQDRERINVNEEHELRRWSDRYGVSPDKLRETVQRVGPMAKDVEQALGRGGGS